MCDPYLSCTSFIMHVKWWTVCMLFISLHVNIDMIVYSSCMNMICINIVLAWPWLEWSIFWDSLVCMHLWKFFYKIYIHKVVCLISLSHGLFILNNWLNNLGVPQGVRYGFGISWYSFYDVTCKALYAKTLNLFLKNL